MAMVAVRPGIEPKNNTYNDTNCNKNNRKGLDDRKQTFQNHSFPSLTVQMCSECLKEAGHSS